MKERPILFSAPMVRALLAGTKTQTRRVAKGVVARHVRTGEALANIDSAGPRVACPYGQPGDRLWVREGWADEHPLAIQENRYSQPGRAGIPGPPPVSFRTIYRADGEPLQIWRNADQSHPYFTIEGPATEIHADYPTVSSNFNRGGKGIYWNPSIYMPRWASRITLEVTGVRVERLQDISVEDAIAEGVNIHPDHYIKPRESIYSAVEAYRDLWESINGPESWDANPWVWVVEVKRI